MQSFKAQAQRGSEIQLPQGLTTNTHTHTDEQGPVLGKMSPSPKGLGTQKPKTNKKIVFLQVLGSIDPGIYRPWDLSALGSIDPGIYRPWDLSALGSIDPRIYRPSDLSTLGSIELTPLGSQVECHLPAWGHAVTRNQWHVPVPTSLLGWVGVCVFV